MPRDFDEFLGAAQQSPGRKNPRLRSGAREAYEYFSGDLKKKTTRQQGVPEKASIFTYRSVGRGASGESSN
jgi:hypothetical protein